MPLLWAANHNGEANIMDPHVIPLWLLITYEFAVSTSRFAFRSLLFASGNVLESQGSVGAWLSLVERTVRDREVGGSNPLAPTNFPKEKATRFEWPSCLCRKLCQTVLV